MSWRVTGEQPRLCDRGVRADGRGDARCPEELYAIPYASHYNPHGLAAGDINGDGFPDVVLADYNNGLVVLRNTAATTPIPAAPNLTAAAASGNGGVALGWNAPASNGGAAITAYKIYRGPTSGGEILITTVGNVTAYTDTSAANGKTSYYQVSGVNAVGEGPRSNELAAKRGR
jgi:hypothetical protein